MPNEADTCRKHVVPELQAAGWDNDPHAIAEQHSITDGRIVPGLDRVRPKTAKARGLSSLLLDQALKGEL